MPFLCVFQSDRIILNTKSWLCESYEILSDLETPHSISTPYANVCSQIITISDVQAPSYFGYDLWVAKMRLVVHAELFYSPTASYILFELGFTLLVKTIHSNIFNSPIPQKMWRKMTLIQFPIINW